MEKFLCLNCKNYLADLSCLAFPVRIPEEILIGGNDHKKPLPNQGNKIVFEKKTYDDAVRPKSTA